MLLKTNINSNTIAQLVKPRALLRLFDVICLSGSVSNVAPGWLVTLLLACSPACFVMPTNWQLICWCLFENRYILSCLAFPTSFE